MIDKYMADISLRYKKNVIKSSDLHSPLSFWCTS